MVVARLGVVVVAVTVAFGMGMLVSTSPQSTRPVPNFAIERSMAIVTGQATRKPHEQMISGGVLEGVRRAREARSGVSLLRGPDSALPVNATIQTVGCSQVFPGTYNNVRVNQGCDFRVRAEEFLVVDPNNPDHLVAAQNDRRIGVNHCSISYSFDRGSHWGDVGIPPLWEFTALDGHKFDHASDPALAMDSSGNTYFTCVIFDDLAAPGGILVTKSNAAFGGAFFHSPAPGPTQAFRTLPLGVVVNTNTPLLFPDKEFIFSDTNRESPKRDNVYVTWTRFRMDQAGNYLESPIFYSQSTDGGATWSPDGGVEISGASSACKLANFFDNGIQANKCNFDQGSWMVIGPDGTLYVFFINDNTNVNINTGTASIPAQQMVVKCPGAKDCTLAASWTAPVKIADDFDTQPFFLGPGAFDPVTGCVNGRQCLPPNGYRLNDFGAAALDPNFGDNGRLYFMWPDFRNGGPCAKDPATGFPVAPCATYNNDVFLVWSDDRAATWSSPKLVSGGAGTQAAQWQPWIAVGPDGTVYVAYYDRQYGNCESSGCNDITLAVSTNHGNTFQKSRITTGSMPNLTPATTPTEFGFLGDYMNIQANDRGAYIVWADTRPHAGTTPEESIFFAFFPHGTEGGGGEGARRR